MPVIVTSWVPVPLGCKQSNKTLPDK